MTDAAIEVRRDLALVIFTLLGWRYHLERRRGCRQRKKQNAQQLESLSGLNL
jgi:hypothetical protein